MSGSGLDREPTVIAKTVARTVVPIILVTAVALLIRGHNLPGGGFIAGVLTVTAFALGYVIYGLDRIRRDLLGLAAGSGEGFSRAAALYSTLFAVGLAVAAGSGLAATLFGHPFLTQAVLFVEHVPLYHEFELASAFVFDLGVYFVVVGALLTILTVVGAE